MRAAITHPNKEKEGENKENEIVKEMKKEKEKEGPLNARLNMQQQSTTIFGKEGRVELDANLFMAATSANDGDNKPRGFVPAVAPPSVPSSTSALNHSTISPIKIDASAAPKRFQCGSSAVPVRFQSGFKTVSKRFQSGSDAVPIKFQCGSKTVPIKFQCGSNAVPINF